MNRTISYTVYDVLMLTEFIGTIVVDFEGNEIIVDDSNRDEIYNSLAEHISAKDNRVIIHTLLNEKEYFEKIEKKTSNIKKFCQRI